MTALFASVAPSSVVATGRAVLPFVGKRPIWAALTHVLFVYSLSRPVSSSYSMHPRSLASSPLARWAWTCATASWYPRLSPGLRKLRSGNSSPHEHFQ